MADVSADPVPVHAMSDAPPARLTTSRAEASATVTALNDMGRTPARRGRGAYLRGRESGTRRQSAASTDGGGRRSSAAEDRDPRMAWQ
jgi:hypothetical protein